jgi:hypothetical protein
MRIFSSGERKSNEKNRSRGNYLQTPTLDITTCPSLLAEQR